MTLVVSRSDSGDVLAAPITLRGRRRLSAVARRIGRKTRPFIVSVHDGDSPLVPTDDSVVLRRDWANTLVGADDVVAITYLTRPR